VITRNTGSTRPEFEIACSTPGGRFGRPWWRGHLPHCKGYTVERYKLGVFVISDWHPTLRLIGAAIEFGMNLPGKVRTSAA
jgi:hypothetical protein